MLTLPTQTQEASARTVLGGDIVLNETAARVLRRWLLDAGLEEWKIFYGTVPHLRAIDTLLDRLDPAAVWESADLALAGGEPLTALAFEEEPESVTRARPGGVLHLRSLRVVVARWFWYDPSKFFVRSLYLLAAPAATCVEDLRRKLLNLHRSPDRPVWNVWGDYGADSTTPRGEPNDHALLLDEKVRRRVDTEIIGFFTPTARRLHERLDVPYRRGLLLYGEPGNGKTSLIRHIGASLPHVACTLLRAGSSFDTDSLVSAFDEWKGQAPAILVIEDLNDVIEKVNLSTLLNVLDGVDRRSRDGLMLIASTNHPEKLDPALSNRPGRFDVVVELASPDEPQRRAYFRQRLIELDLPTLDKAAGDTKGMSFAHLEEVVRLSGMVAIRAAREFRTPADLSEAVAHVRDAFNRARTGYAKLPEAPFGLLGFRSNA